MSYKVVQSNPAADTPTDLYTVPANTNAVISTISICNYSTTTTADYTIRIRPSGATAADEHIFAFNVTLSISETAFITVGIALSATDVITVEADTADVTFMAFVNEVETG